jgi:hypothetical protein
VAQEIDMTTTLALPPNFNQDKAETIDFAYQRIWPRPMTFADLGGVWGVDGAYTLYTLQKFGASRAVLVDSNHTDKVMEMARQFPSLSLIKGNFGDPAIQAQVGDVDAILLFDVLLHQVKPDWDQILAMYAPHTRIFVVYNQQFVGSQKTVRLLDLGREEYFANVPGDPNLPPYSTLFEKMYEINPEHNRIWRDVHNVWQWGIVDRDLVGCLDRLGFTMQLYKNCGQWGALRNIQNHAFVFQKR